jgi:DNA polymerase-3 subunit gamma/tau
MDVIEIDAASNTGVDNIRELIERSRFAPVSARWKVYVIDECHMLSTAAFNALLKTLEEPPPRVVFVLATTDPQRVLPTILSRCQRFDFRRIPLEALESHLRWIAEQEGIGISQEALHVVAQRAQGGLRDAESLLDQLSLLPAPIEALAVWELLGAVPEEELLVLAEAMAAAEPLAVVEASRGLLERGREPGAVLQGVAGLLRDLLLAGVAPDRLELTTVSPALRPRLPKLAQRVGKQRLLQWQAQLRGSEQQLRHSVQPRLWLEVLLLGLLAEPRATQARASQEPAAKVAAPPPAIPAPAPSPVPSAAAAVAGVAVAGPDLAELWQQILAGLELPSTRMLLSQQAQLVRLDERRAVVRVSGTWMAMVESRKPLLEKAMASALGGDRLLQLETGGEPPERPRSEPTQPLVAPPSPPVPVSVSVPVPVPVPEVSGSTPPATAPPPPPPQAPAVRSPLEERARRLADFFNGDVIEGLEEDVA